jgi:hypothetical protein
MKHAKLPPIPTAFGQRVLEFRLVFLPVLVFGSALLLVAVLWQSHGESNLPITPTENGLVNQTPKPTIEVAPVVTKAPPHVVNVLQPPHEPLPSDSREMSERKPTTAQD